MRTAVCIHGLSRGSTVLSSGAYDEKFKSLKNKIKDCDVFIHSWDIDIEEKIKNIFNPISFLFEKQKTFHKEKISFNTCDIYSKNTSPRQGDIFKTLSFLYSRMKSIELKREKEIKENFIYDCVLTTRFDVGHHNFGKNKTSHLSFDCSKDMNMIYQAFWDQMNAGLSDHWFYSSSKNIDKIGNLYNCLFEYINPNSEYAQLCRTGWPLSNERDEFSNEMLKKEKTEKLKRLTVGKTLLVNNHCLYKYHFIKNNLLDKSIFLNEELWK